MSPSKRLLNEPSTNAPPALLLDLSGNTDAARAWAARQFQTYQTVNKADLKWVSKRQAFAHIRRLAPQTLAFFTSDLTLQSARGAMMLFAALAGARHVVFGDNRGHLIERARWTVLAIEAPRLAIELVAGYLLVVPLSWLLTIVLALSLRFRKPVRHSRQKPPRNHTTGDCSTSQTALYIRATLTSAREGGMATHVSGFASGARQLGHRLTFLVSSHSPNDEHAAGEQYNIPASATFSATRALFELWNNLVFTNQTLAWFRAADSTRPAVDFIYQRYSRFNWTGVVLSVLTGLPLALEFNGSEVWVSQRWDPVGQFQLLKKFESLALRAADLIFTVSEVERRNLMQAGVAGHRIIANPNGVDVDRFRPACGGETIRRALALEDKVLVGFLGTFGPWHGAPVLAAATKKLPASCHVLFVGDGDQRALTEEMLATEKDRATFVGRIAHDEVARYLDACDILVAPHVASPDGSEFFGSPTKLFEYLAMQKPVVASRLGQIAEVIADGDNGLLVEPGDAEALARAIINLAANRDLCRRLGEAARRTVVERFTWTHNAARVFAAMKTTAL